MFMAKPCEDTMYSLLLSKLSFLGFYLFGFCCSHFTGSPRFSLFQCVAGRWDWKAEGRRNPASGEGWAALPWAAVLSGNPPQLLYSPYSLCLQGLVLNPQGQHTCQSTKDHLLANPFGTYLMPCLCGPGQELPCILGDLCSHIMSSSSYPWD